MSTTGTNTSTQACWPSVNCVFNQRLLQVMPHTQQTCRRSSMSWTLVSYTRCWMLAEGIYSCFQSIKIFQSHDQKYAAMFFSYSKSALCVWTVIISFSQGKVNTLFRWGGHIFHMCVKRFFLLTAMQKLSKSTVFFQSYDHKYTATFFGSQCTSYFGLTDCNGLHYNTARPHSLNSSRVSIHMDCLRMFVWVCCMRIAHASVRVVSSVRATDPLMDECSRAVKNFNKKAA